MAQPYNYYVGNGVLATYEFTQEINDNATVVGLVDFESASGTWNPGTGFFTFDSAPASGAHVHIVRDTSTDDPIHLFPNKSYINSDNLDGNSEGFLHRMEELKFYIDDNKRRADGNVGYAQEWATKAEDSLISLEAGGDGVTDYSSLHWAAKSAASATAAQTAQTAAETAETNAETAETNAETAETNAAASAAAAAASAVAAAATVQSALWRDVEFKSYADDPITLTAADNGKLFAIDCTGGHVSVLLPEISTVTLPFNVGFKKTDSSSNGILPARSGASDLINGSVTNIFLGVENGGATLVADTDPTPDSWTAMTFGAGVSNKIGDIFVDGVDYTAGTSTQLTLSGSPGSVNNVSITFDGVVQHTDQYSLLANVVTFTSAIPLGVSTINAVQGGALDIGEPADGTVSAAKLQTNSVTEPKLDSNAIVWSKVSNIVVDEDDMVSNSAVLLPTQQSVKEFARFKGVRARRTTIQVMPTAGWATFVYESEDFDTDSLWSVGDGSKFYVPAGVTKVRMKAFFAYDNTTATGYRALRLGYKGTFLGYGEDNRQPWSTTVTEFLEVDSGIRVMTGDGTEYFQVQMYSNAGVALNTNPSYGIWAELELIE